MLSSSALAFGYELNLASIGDPSLETGVPGGTELLRFVDAVLTGTPDALGAAQAQIVSVLGPEALVDAASVHGNFEMMNRVAEGTGIPIPVQAIERMAQEIELLGIATFLKS